MPNLVNRKNKQIINIHVTYLFQVLKVGAEFIAQSKKHCHVRGPQMYGNDNKHVMLKKTFKTLFFMRKTQILVHKFISICLFAIFRIL